VKPRRTNVQNTIRGVKYEYIFRKKTLNLRHFSAFGDYGKTAENASNALEIANLGPTGLSTDAPYYTVTHMPVS
jgi:hypothetical protein